MSHLLVVGMRGPYARISVAFAAPPGVDFTATPPTIASLAFNGPGGNTFSVTEAQVTWVVTASKATATYEPTGAEVAAKGAWAVTATLTVDGDAVDYRTTNAQADAR